MRALVEDDDLLAHAAVWRSTGRAGARSAPPRVDVGGVEAVAAALEEVVEHHGGVRHGALIVDAHAPAARPACRCRRSCRRASCASARTASGRRCTVADGVRLLRVVDEADGFAPRVERAMLPSVSSQVIAGGWRLASCDLRRDVSASRRRDRSSAVDRRSRRGSSPARWTMMFVGSPPSARQSTGRAPRCCPRSRRCARRFPAGPARRSPAARRCRRESAARRRRIRRRRCRADTRRRPALAIGSANGLPVRGAGDQAGHGDGIAADIEDAAAAESLIEAGARQGRSRRRS